ncbi:MAG: hypothetical protein KDC01_01875 [Flavobacteriales bacterium]|nr:hypothetical protein [Flavobacteriales bacterium]
MRNVILPLFMVALPAFAFASGPAKMLVVVRTSDRVVLKYVCNSDKGEGPDARVFRTEVQSAGGMNWHVVGGVAPYTVVKNNMATSSGGCVTVMDAEGQVATGCGVVGVQWVRVAVDCQGEDLDEGPYGLVPSDSTDMQRPGWKDNTSTPVGPTEIMKPRSSAPTPDRPGGDPADSYHPPVKIRVPNTPPPVPPRTAVLKGKKGFVPSPVPPPSPAPRPLPGNTDHRQPTLQPQRSGSGISSPGSTPRPVPPPVQRTPAKQSL